MSTQNAGDPLLIDLSRFDREYAKAGAAEDDYYDDIPDGTYEGVIEDAHLTETVSTGRPVVLWTLRITGPQALNRVVHRNRVITEKTLTWLKEDLSKCGLALEKISDLPHRIGELNGRPVSFDKKTKDGRMNIYFRWNSRKSEAVADDGLPF
jgi:hypothetical protein